MQGSRTLKPYDLTRYIPTCREEMNARGWDELDVLFVTGDAYIDHPAFGTPLLARLLEDEGFRVGILAQPNWKNPEALKVMGRPRLFAAISAGAMDSMVNHYTAAKRLRSDDAYTPGGVAGKRPNRAVIAYTAAVKGAFKGLPTVIGGIEASLRRLAHYDYWEDKVRRSVLVDSKADLLLYGMAESAIIKLTRALDTGAEIGTIRDLPGTAYLSNETPEEAITLPSFEDVCNDPEQYNKAFKLASEQQNPYAAKPLTQLHGPRTLVINPPALPLDETEMDRVYSLPFSRQPHPSYQEDIPAWKQIHFSITSHRGCFGGCAFCAITHHQGKTIQSRSQDSIAAELDTMTRHPEFRGTVTDVGGPTANMYGLGCNDPQAEQKCRRTSCLYPQPCRNLRTDDRKATRLLRQLRSHDKVKHLFVASGIRYDLLQKQQNYFDDLLQHHVGGLLKVAPESTSDKVCKVMHKPAGKLFTEFLEKFRARSSELGLRQGIVPYFISSHPGCELNDMVDVALYLKQNRLQVEQVQDFTPTPGSLATCIYHTGSDPFSGERIHVPRSAKERRLQKALLLYHKPGLKQDVLEALRITGREGLIEEILPSTMTKRPQENKLRKSASGRKSSRLKRGHPK